MGARAFTLESDGVVYLHAERALYISCIPGVEEAPIAGGAM